MKLAPYILSKRILIVDDTQEIRMLLKTIFENEGFENLLFAASFTEARKLIERAEIDLAILDVMLPDGDGVTLAQYLRLCGPEEIKGIPIIFLTAKDQPQDKIIGFEVGGDDYLAKPFLPQELILRVSSLIKRCYQEEPTGIDLAWSKIDFLRAEVLRNDGTTLPLTPKEFALLKVLSDNAGRIVTTDNICDALWDDGPFGYENTLMTHVRRVREKIEENPSKPQSLITVKGLGYKLIVSH